MIFWTLWDDGEPGGGIAKPSTAGTETIPSACGIGDADCEAINPTNEIRITIVNFAMFTTFSLNNWTRMIERNNKISIKYTKVSIKTEICPQKLSANFYYER